MGKMNGNSGPKDAIKLAQDITKLILTLTTGLLALSGTFINFLGSDLKEINILIFAWTLFIISIIAGILTLSSMVNLLLANKYDPFANQTKYPAIIQWTTYILGFSILLYFIKLNIS